MQSNKSSRRQPEKRGFVEWGWVGNHTGRGHEKRTDRSTVKCPQITPSSNVNLGALRGESRCYLPSPAYLSLSFSHSISSCLLEASSAAKFIS